MSFGQELNTSILAAVDAEIENPTRGVHINPKDPKSFVSMERMRLHFQNNGVVSLNLANTLARQAIQLHNGRR